MSRPPPRTLRSGRVFGGSTPDLRTSFRRDDGAEEVVEDVGQSPTPQVAPPPAALEQIVTNLLADFRTSLFTEVQGRIRECYEDIRDEFRLQRNFTPFPADPVVQPQPKPLVHARSQFKPLPYDGSIAWEDYREHFEVVAESNAWDAREMGLALASSLTGPTLSVLSELGKVEKKDFNRLSDVLSIQFGDGSRAQMYMDRLKSRRQHPEEDIAVFGQEIRKLSRKALPGASKECVEILAVSQFSENLLNERVRELVMLSAPKTLEAAISSALQSESAVLRAKGSLSNRRPVYPATQPAYPARPLCVVRDSPATCWRCDGQGHTMRECPTKVLICWRCDQPGHGLRDCPTKKAGNE
ncbi:ZnF_C2HC [Nesidiocoris tenuis]|uniref:ZnF_C2HC n=1 Tax=Nesidiocoris tenuis TaxID=355587 RepID=A0ABN7AH36_9HEMI|nr:ZnF_C2HC [Nesidiocoris tenuis]BES96799.1 ZnF_C2HC [Nesidiocoris tenuis]BET00634.1 ZnF_C2HC [Nesidiocoris tenuis]